ncbi:AzlD domain-containing protein [Metallumcola ferriviriculae]|uniref:AzlD domain-containing protein n=1 Tax=Metallumcola ferriviriculae TaxID=3039180 RepID=A0AAU0URR0_9FIRM|nr:AzlD domain-containing protein [Desulfitibacteraceae bacterium MK1]
MDYIWAIIIGAAIVTYIPRALPLVTFSKKNLPPLVIQWLRFIPPAVLAALLAPELFLNQRHFDFSLQNIGLLTAIPCFIIAVKSRSMVVTVVSGMIIYILLNTLL